MQAFALLVLTFAVLIWGAATALSRRTNKWLRIGYLVCVVAAGFGSYYSTIHYNYKPDENTMIYGWPVPAAVIKRESPQDNWIDYVMPVFVAYPMNFLLFMVLPGIATIVLARFTRPPAPPWHKS